MGVSNRTWLFVPATTPQRFAGAAASGADAVILDLEDAVGVDAKDSAPGSAAAWLSNAGRAWVRVNATGTPWHDDDVAADLVAAEARRSRALGFGGKLCIHPAQLEAVARVFAPTAEQLAWARGVVEAAAAAGGGVATGPDGHMIDKPVIDRARAILRD
ncbi:aldolase/citrate lyase family protein [Streptomyces sp. NBC_01716]|uniref:aldolase/citrate lyase family protein n=1 Tax=Streptomyces sp. NBC_01716 TaxID=2975917 RepID=UPI002E32A354|nr:aldolase/citrate lyase family protein [Streptomyces sp. NBC_01716]